MTKKPFLPSAEERSRLTERARDALQSKDWKRAHKEVKALLALDGANPEAWFLRALLFEHDGEPLWALVHGLFARYQISDANQSFAREVAAALKRIETAASALSDARKRSAAPTLMQWLKEHRLLKSSAEDLRRVIPGAEAAFSYAAFAPGGTRAEVEQVLALAPDSPSLQLKLARRMFDDEEWDAAEKLARRALLNLGRYSLVEDVARQCDDQATEAEILTLLARVSSERKRHAETVTLAKRLLTLEPRSPWGHNCLPIALTFCNQHQEAIKAYGEAIRVFEGMDGQYWSVSARALMYFNRGCELARLGRRKPAFADLEHAVQLNAEYAEGAQSEEYFKAYWQDPGFVAIVRPPVEAKRSATEREQAVHARAVAEYVSTIDYEFSFGEMRWREGIDEPAEYLRRAKRAAWSRVRAREDIGALGELDEREDERPTLKRFISHLRSELASLCSRDAANALIRRLVAWLDEKQLKFVRGVLWEAEGNHNDTTILIRVRRPARGRSTKRNG